MLQKEIKKLISFCRETREKPHFFTWIMSLIESDKAQIG
jgi:hypothetical protein